MDDAVDSISSVRCSVPTLAANLLAVDYRESAVRAVPNCAARFLPLVQPIG